jgi:hypothetical protein
MAILRLHELINLYRDEIIRRCESTAGPQATGDWMPQGVAAFLDQLMVELRESPQREVIDEVVMPGGDELISPMSSVSQLTQPYRGVGRSVIEIALELNVPISADDFVMLDRCLDVAIADAVTQHVRMQKIGSDRAVNTLQDLTNTAISAFEVLQTGTVGVVGKTGTLVLRSLMDIRALTELTT